MAWIGLCEATQWACKIKSRRKIESSLSFSYPQIGTENLDWKIANQVERSELW